MDMFTSYGHIKKPNKITDFLTILAWASPFNQTTGVNTRFGVKPHAQKELRPSTGLILAVSRSKVKFAHSHGVV